jgi:hypothetical protein
MPAKELSVPSLRWLHGVIFRRGAMFLEAISMSCRRLALAILGAISIGGCAVVDQYGPRSITYNQEEASSKSSSILLNILRATYRQPLQFTDMSQVLGSASAGATITGTSIPFRVGGPQFSMPETAILSPAVTASGGPQFTVTNLNNQEFYQGLQSPLEPQFIANYAAQGVPLKVLLTLFISDIQIEEGKTKKKYIIHNSAETQAAYNNFITAIDRLVRAGLTLEQAKSADSIGPILTPLQASDPKLLAGLVQAASAATGGSSFNLQPVTTNGVVDKSKFQLSKPGGKWQFCFSPKPEQLFPDDGFMILDPRNTKKDVPIQFANLKVAAELSGAACGTSNNRAKSTDSKVQVTNNVSFIPRSVEGIYLYLGEMARTELGLTGREVAQLPDPNGKPEALFPVNSPSRGPVYLFKVDQRFASGSDIGANFDGASYAIAVDPTGADASSQVIQIMSDLQALKSSAKNLPAPSVVSVAQ